MPGLIAAQVLGRAGATRDRTSTLGAEDAGSPPRGICAVGCRRWGCPGAGPAAVAARTTLENLTRISAPPRFRRTIPSSTEPGTKGKPGSFQNPSFIIGEPCVVTESYWDCTHRHLFGAFAWSDKTAVHWVFIREDKMCQLETSYDQEADCYLVTVHTNSGRTETERFQDADLFNMYLVAIESALDRAGWRPAVPNRPLFMPGSPGKRPDWVH